MASITISISTLSPSQKLVAFIFIPSRLCETESLSCVRSFEAVTLEEKRQRDERTGRKKERRIGGRPGVEVGVEGWKEQVEVGGKSWTAAGIGTQRVGGGGSKKKSSLLLFPISLVSLMHRRPVAPLVLFGPVDGKSNEFQVCRPVSFPPSL